MKLATKMLLIMGLSTMLCTSLLAAPSSSTSATSIAASVLSTSEKPVLTLEDAISSAISRNNNLSLNSQQHTVLTEQLYGMDNVGSSNYEKLYISLNQNEQQKEFLKDQINSDITKRYNNIILLEKEIETIEQDILLQKESIQTLEKQQKVGLATPLQVQSSNLELSTLQANKLAKEENLKSEKSNFQILTNKDLDKYTLEDTITFEAFRIDNVKGYFQAKADKYLKYQNELAELQNNNIFDNFVNPLTGSGYAPTYAEYLSTKYSANSAKLGIEDSRNNLIQSLTTSYASLLNMEEQITTLKSQISFLEKQLETLALQRKVGLVTKLDYDKQANKLGDLQYNLLSLTNSYNTLANVLQKPWSN